MKEKNREWSLCSFSVSPLSGASFAGRFFGLCVCVSARCFLSSLWSGFLLVLRRIGSSTCRPLCKRYPKRGGTSNKPCPEHTLYQHLCMRWLEGTASHNCLSSEEKKKKHVRGAGSKRSAAKVSANSVVPDPSFQLLMFLLQGWFPWLPHVDS